MNRETETPDRLGQLIRDYLGAVERAMAGQPEQRRTELLSDLDDHIAAEYAALDPPTEAAVRVILDRLGDPGTIATEARLLGDEPSGPVPVAPAIPVAPAAPPLPVALAAPSLPVAPAAPAAPATPVAPVGGAGSGGRRRPGPVGWILIAVGATLLVCLLIVMIGGLTFFSARDGSAEPAPAPTVAPLSPTPG